MWWESHPFAAQSDLQPVPSAEFAAVDPLSYDWSALGLAPHDLTQEVLDTLSGQIAWIDQPDSHSSAGAPQSREGERDRRNGEHEGEGQVVRMQYFRLLGPTGISPGIKKISMEFRLTPLLRKALFDSDSPAALRGRQRLDWDRLLSMGQQQGTAERQPATRMGAVDPVNLFSGDLPAAWVLDELVPIFFDRLGDHYLCLHREGLERRLADTGQRTPPMLLNVICALAARYSTDERIVAGRPREESHSFGVVFADKAKDLLAPSLSVPSRTTTLAFLMMAWHEFACNLDSAFWNYAGMALRMAIDLGIHRQAALSGPRDLADVDLIDDALLFWAVYQMDRVLAMGTGRPTSIKDREITCPLPSPSDNALFAHHIRHTRIAGEIAEALNAVVRRHRVRCRCGR